MTINLRPADVPAWVLWALDLVTALAFAIVFLGIVLRFWGVVVPFVPMVDHQTIAYYAGGWFLYRKARQ